MNYALLLDIGSTFTKARAVDLDKESIAGSVQVPTTGGDLSLGCRQAKEIIEKDLGIDHLEYSGACSSAGGGLRVVAVGLVESLTLQAARQTALNAGSRIVGTYAMRLKRAQLEEIAKTNPDIILFVGGTNGGNNDIVLDNAAAIAGSRLKVPVVFAGNSTLQPEIKKLFGCKGKRVFLTENVLPAIDMINPEPARDRIRNIFIKDVIAAKGWAGSNNFRGKVAMATPEAVLQAAQLLAEGPRGDGLGNIMVVDIGGATTDVHSLSEAKTNYSAIKAVGSPEPKAKRTVEGDLGLRLNALSIVEVAERMPCLSSFPNRFFPSTDELKSACALIDERYDCIPGQVEDLLFKLDFTLASIAVEVAVKRHAGYFRTKLGCSGARILQYGKDLRNISYVIGTGGILATHPYPEELLAYAFFNPQEASSLRPHNPKILVDRSYILPAAGIIATKYRQAAFNLMTKSLQVFSCSKVL